jgi:hypothetical protein
MKPLTTEQIRAVIARGKLKDAIFKVGHLLPVARPGRHRRCWSPTW